VPVPEVKPVAVIRPLAVTGVVAVAPFITKLDTLPKTKIKEKGLTVIPIRLFLSDRGLAKLEIALAKGKKIHDKRESIKEREMKRELQRERK